MQKTRVVTIALLSFAVLVQSSGLAAQKTSGAGIEKEIIALERAALDRYLARDPGGYLSLYAPDVTYFDPMTERRVDGIKAMQEWLAPVRTAKVTLTAQRYELIHPTVQAYGDLALLTFNLTQYGTPPKKPEQVVARWNITEVYRRLDRKWVIVHSHFSFVKPDIKSPGA